MRGSRDVAIALLEVAIARGGDDRARCEMLLAALRARPTDRVSGPPLSLDAELVEALAAAGRLREARVVAGGIDIGRSSLGVEIGRALEHVCADPQLLGPPWSSRWEEVVGKGSLVALSGIEREGKAGVRVPAWLRDRLDVAGRLLRGFSLTSSTDVGERASPDGPDLPEDVRRTLAGLVARRDLPNALRQARLAAEADAPGAAAVAAVLARLVAATERAAAAEAALSTATLPMEGPGLALMQLRMGNLDQAEKGFRRVALESPSDHVSSEHLSDLVALRRALAPTEQRISRAPGVEGSDGRGRKIELPPAPGTPSIGGVGGASSPGGTPSLGSAPLEKDRTPAPGWLDKKKGKPGGVEGWAARPKEGPSGADMWDEDPSTAVMRADHEAELLLKAGHPTRARQLYAKLLGQFPENARFAERLSQIDAMIAEKTALIASEPTIRKAMPVAPPATGGAASKGEVPGGPAVPPSRPALRSASRPKDDDDAFAPTPSIPIDRAEIRAEIRGDVRADVVVVVPVRKIVPIR